MSGEAEAGPVTWATREAAAEAVHYALSVMSALDNGRSEKVYGDGMDRGFQALAALRTAPGRIAQLYLVEYRRLGRALLEEKRSR